MSDAKEQAQLQVEGIVDLITALNCDFEAIDDIRQIITDIENDHEADVRDLIQHQEELEDLLYEAGGYEDTDAVRTAIYEDPLSIQFRSGWVAPFEEMIPEEFEILLCTGGPAVRIIGELDEEGYPSSPRVQYQDWFEPWTEYFPTKSERESIERYCTEVLGC